MENQLYGEFFERVEEFLQLLSLTRSVVFISNASSLLESKRLFAVCSFDSVRNMAFWHDFLNKSGYTEDLAYSGASSVISFYEKFKSLECLLAQCFLFSNASTDREIMLSFSESPLRTCVRSMSATSEMNIATCQGLYVFFPCLASQNRYLAFGVDANQRRPPGYQAASFRDVFQSPEVCGRRSVDDGITVFREFSSGLAESYGLLVGSFEMQHSKDEFWEIHI